MDPDALLDLFATTSSAVRDALGGVSGPRRRERTARPGQYAIDLVADEAALGVLGAAPVTIVSEESGVTAPGRPITVVLDPVDGSSNAVRHLPYWAISLAALDADGLLAAMVVNQATGTVTTASRGGGAHRDGAPLVPSTATRVEDSVVAISAFPSRMLAWKQFRALGSCALALCDVAAGVFDGYLDGASVHAPWDYLGALLVCEEVGVSVSDAADRPLVVADPSARRQLVAAATLELAASLRTATA